MENLEIFEKVKNEMLQDIRSGNLHFWQAFYEEGANSNCLIYRHDIVEYSKQVFIKVYDNGKIIIRYKNNNETMEFTENK